MSTFFLPHLPTSRTLPSEDLFATGGIQVLFSSSLDFEIALFVSFNLLLSERVSSSPNASCCFRSSSGHPYYPLAPPSPPFVRIQVSSCCHLSASFLLSQSVQFSSHPHTYNPRFGQRCHHIIAARLTRLCSLFCPASTYRRGLFGPFLAVTQRLAS